jgi:hypothetical protein
MRGDKLWAIIKHCPIEGTHIADFGLALTGSPGLPMVTVYPKLATSFFRLASQAERDTRIPHVVTEYQKVDCTLTALSGTENQPKAGN